MSYFTATNAVLMLFLYVKCFFCMLFIVRLMNYFSWYFLLVVSEPLVTQRVVTLLLTFPYISGRSLFF